MIRPDPSPHPDPATLEQFAVGRLRGEAMRRIERHVRDCEVCVQTALAAPDDRLVSLLRRTRSSGQPWGRPIPGRDRLILLVGLGLVGISMLSGCSPNGVGSVDWADNPKARAIGAPPRLPEKTKQPPARRATKKTPGYFPG